jgi:hypothetical protein
MRKVCVQLPGRLWVACGQVAGYPQTMLRTLFWGVGNRAGYTPDRTHFVPGVSPSNFYIPPLLFAVYARFPQRLLTTTAR